MTKKEPKPRTKTKTKTVKLPKSRCMSFKPFLSSKGKGGVLCFVVKVPYKGVGKPVMILHEATVDPSNGVASFSYGNKRHWVIR